MRNPRRQSALAGARAIAIHSRERQRSAVESPNGIFGVS
jgi:hypothetical protein